MGNKPNPDLSGQAVGDGVRVCVIVGGPTPQPQLTLHLCTRYYSLGAGKVLKQSKMAKLHIHPIGLGLLFFGLAAWWVGLGTIPKFLSDISFARAPSSPPQPCLVPKQLRGQADGLASPRAAPCWSDGVLLAWTSSDFPPIDSAGLWPWED